MSNKIFVLDTSVILYDYQAINSFQEHDVAIPITVLEELDNFKKGNTVLNFCAREFIRFLDEHSKEHLLQEWIPLPAPSQGRFKVLIGNSARVGRAGVLEGGKNDHKILNAALHLQENEPDKTVILVTKDIALRLKAKALNLQAEDYETGKVHDLDTFYSGKGIISNLMTDIINHLYNEDSLPKASLDFEPMNNQYFILKNGQKSALARFSKSKDAYFLVEKRTISGITPRNAEQIFAIDALMSPDIKLITLQGVAGTGKTLLALAAAIEQRREFRQIYVTRPVVPLSNNDIGFLPGDINSKLNPYMEPLWDNLKYIKSNYRESDKEVKLIDEMVANEKIEILPLAYIRGRSLSNVYIIVDEAQNLTPHEIKTIITRAGENTKIVFTGDIHQIDTPYLDSQSNGLSYLIDRFQGAELFAHVQLEKGERSELANLASQLL